MPPDGYSPLFGLSQRLPPANLQAEMSLLGAVLADNRTYERVADYLLPEHFADPMNATIYRTVAAAILDGYSVDAVTIKNACEGTGSLDEVGGTKYLAQILSAMVSPQLAGDYGRAVYDTWVRRQLIEVGESIVERAFGADLAMSGAAQIEAAEAQLADLGTGSRRTGDRMMSLGHAVSAAVAQAESVYRGGRVPAAMSGMAAVDRAFGGFWPGEYDLLAGIPGSGKTALAVQIAYAIGRTLADQALAAGATPEEAARQPGVVVFSLEMSAESLGTRIAAYLAHVSVERLLRGELDMMAAAELVQAENTCRFLPVRVRDARSSGMALLPAKIRLHLRRQPETLVVVDHLLADESDLRSVAGRSLALRRLAAETGTPFLVLTHASRSLARTSLRPVMQDIKWAGEGDADAVVFVHRPALVMDSNRPPRGAREGEERYQERINRWRQELDDAAGLAELVVAKRRQGATGVYRMRFDGPTTSFHEWGGVSET
jgi:replicative DNA helicase